MIVRDAYGREHHFDDEWEQDFEIEIVPQREGGKKFLHPWNNHTARTRAGVFGIAAKKKHQKETIRKGLERCAVAPDLPVHIVLTRVAHRGKLDDDGVPDAMKYVRDEIARWMGLRSDRQKPGFRFFYDQQRTSREGYLGVRVTIYKP